MASQQDSGQPSFSQQLLQWEAANGWPTPILSAFVLVPVYLVARLVGVILSLGRAGVSRLRPRR